MNRILGFKLGAIALLIVLLLLQELQAFYAIYLAPSSSSRRKLCVHVVPTSSKGSKAAAEVRPDKLVQPGQLHGFKRR